MSPEPHEVDWPAYPWMVETGRAHWRLPDGATPIPLEYTLEARNPACAPGGGGFSGSLSFPSSPGGGVPPELPIQH